jgi:hypothetical protein
MRFPKPRLTIKFEMNTFIEQQNRSEAEEQ